MRALTLLAFFLLACIMCSAFLFSMYQGELKTAKIVEDFSVEQVTVTMKSIIENEIQTIKTRRSELLEEARENIERMASQLDLLAGENYHAQRDMESLQEAMRALFPSYTVIMWSEQTQQVINPPEGFYEKYTFDGLQAALENTPAYVIRKFGQEFYFAFSVSEETLYNRLVDSVRAELYSKVYPNGAYIWINEVHDYGGGDGYATRLIHPNLRDTEGMSLSTEMKDVNGATPYLDELNQVNETGEVLQTYNFKELDSGKESMKISYGKLYEGYDWIVATGMYLNGINEMIDGVLLGNRKEYQRRQIFFVIVSAFFLCAAMVGFVFIEKRYFTETSSQYSRLEKEKQNLETEAYIDILTGCKTRRVMERYLSNGFLKFDTSGTSASILLLDLDNFKQVNDRYGHAAGDQILRKTADAMMESTRSDDAVCRWGGEEFMILLTGAPQRKAAVIADRIREDVMKSSLPFDGVDVSITVSIGVSEFLPDDTSFIDAVNRADKAMYEAKKAGKNMVKIYSDTV